MTFFFLQEAKARMDEKEKEKKKAEQGPAWWYEPVGSKVTQHLLLSIGS